MRALYWVLALVTVGMCAGGDTLAFDATFEAFEDGDTIYAVAHFHAPHDSTKAVINGRLGNANLAADAEIDFSKMDTVGRAKMDTLHVSDSAFIDTLAVNVIRGTASASDSVYAAKFASPSVNIDGGAIDGATIGGSSAGAGTFTTLNATGGGSLTGTWSDLGTVTTIDVNGGTVDNATIGASTPSTGAFTTLSATGNATLGNVLLGSNSISNDGTGGLTFDASGDATQTGDLTISGNSYITGSLFEITDDAATGIYGASTATNGSAILLYGRDHASNAGNVYHRYGGYDATGTMYFQHRTSSAFENVLALGSSKNATFYGNIFLGSNSISNNGTGGLTFDASGDATQTGDLAVTGTVNGMTFSDTAVACTLSRSTSDIVYDGTPDTVGTIMFVKMGRIVSAYLYGISVTIDTVTAQGSGIYLETNELPQTYEHTRNYFDTYPNIPYSVAASGVNGANVVRSYGNGSNFKLRYHVQDGGSNWQGSNSDIFFKNVNITYICD